MAGLTPSPNILVSLFSLFFFTLLVSAHDHVERHALPSRTWHHDARSPLHALFRRAGQTNFPTVGSPTWLAAYPTGTPDSTKMPAAWTNALNAALLANKIPNIPPTSLVNGFPTYPNNLNMLDPTICSATGKCQAPGDVWNAPTGTIGIGFDDGPVAFNDSSANLYAFLKSHNQVATHFMIGVAIYQAPTVFLEAFNNGDDIAAHTYTHPYMTSLSNADVVAQFGWSMQIIYDSTQGRIPKFWRPPMGNMDNRVRAIASEIFGLTPIMWNNDSEDWTMTQAGGTTPAELAANLTQWITGPKSPGLIILEHELTNQTVQAFINAYPQMLANKWKTTSVARLVPSQMDNVTGQPYWNAAPGANTPVTPAGGILDHGDFASAASSSVPPPSSTSSFVPSLPTSGPPPSSSAPSSPPASSSQPSKSSDASRRYGYSVPLLFSLVAWSYFQ